MDDIVDEQQAYTHRTELVEEYSVVDEEEHEGAGGGDHESLFPDTVEADGGGEEDHESHPQSTSEIEDGDEEDPETPPLPTLEPVRRSGRTEPRVSSPPKPPKPVSLRDLSNREILMQRCPRLLPRVDSMYDMELVALDALSEEDDRDDRHDSVIGDAFDVAMPDWEPSAERGAMAVDEAHPALTLDGHITSVEDGQTLISSPLLPPSRPCLSGAAPAEKSPNSIGLAHDAPAQSDEQLSLLRDDLMIAPLDPFIEDPSNTIAVAQRPSSELRKIPANAQSKWASKLVSSATQHTPSSSYGMSTIATTTVTQAIRETASHYTGSRLIAAKPSGNSPGRTALLCPRGGGSTYPPMNHGVDGNAICSEYAGYQPKHGACRPVPGFQMQPATSPTSERNTPVVGVPFIDNQLLSGQTTELATASPGPPRWQPYPRYPNEVPPDYYASRPVLRPGIHGWSSRELSERGRPSYPSCPSYPSMPDGRSFIDPMADYQQPLASAAPHRRSQPPLVAVAEDWEARLQMEYQSQIEYARQHNMKPAAFQQASDTYQDARRLMLQQGVQVNAEPARDALFPRPHVSPQMQSATQPPAVDCQYYSSPTPRSHSDTVTGDRPCGVDLPAQQSSPQHAAPVAQYQHRSVTGTAGSLYVEDWQLHYGHDPADGNHYTACPPPVSTPYQQAPNQKYDKQHTGYPLQSTTPSARMRVVEPTTAERWANDQPL